MKSNLSWLAAINVSENLSIWIRIISFIIDIDKTINNILRFYLKLFAYNLVIKCVVQRWKCFSAEKIEIKGDLIIRHNTLSSLHAKSTSVNT